MLGYLADGFRILWHSVALNLRKSFRRNCQDRSDSGRALETRCGCVYTFSHPRMLRVLCPHLIFHDGDWRCGVDKAGIRGSWARSAALWMAVGLAIYLAVGVLLFAVFQATGARVQVVDTIWPGRWSRVTGARAEQFYSEAESALAEGRLQEAQVAAASSYQFQKTFEAGLLLAQLNSLGGGTNERLFHELIADHPERAGEVRLLWARDLLYAKDFSGLRELAKQSLRKDRALVWVRLYAVSVADRMAPKMKEDAGEVPAIADLVAVLEERQLPRTAGEAFLLLASGHRNAITEPSALPLLPDDLRFVEGLYYLEQQQPEVHEQACAALVEKPAAQPVLALYLLAHPQERWITILADKAENPKSLLPILFLACMKQELAKALQYSQNIYKTKVGTDATLMQLGGKPTPAQFLRTLTGLSLDSLLVYYEPDAYSF